MIRQALLAFTVVAATSAIAAPYQAGRQYKLVQPAVATNVKPGQIEVIEFFSIGCPHCAEFEPYLQGWTKRKPANAVLVRVPATFNPFFKLMARAHYALEDVKAVEKATPLLFEAIHADRDPALLRPLGEYNSRAAANDVAGTAAAEKQVLDALVAFLVPRVGLDEKKFRAAWSSFSMNTRLAQADAVYRKYAVRGVPAIAVNGKYFTGAGREFEINGYGELTKVLEHLVSLESKTAK